MMPSDAEWARRATDEYASGYRDSAAFLTGAAAGYHGPHQDVVRAFAASAIKALEEQAATIKRIADEGDDAGRPAPGMGSLTT